MIRNETLCLPEALLCLAVALGGACSRKAPGPAMGRPDAETAKRGSIEVTARLIEVPERAIFERELYNYVTVLKYQVLQVHRGEIDGETIYVGHYNPFKPRSEAADKRVPDVGGNLKTFRALQVHRLALDGSVDDHYMGGIVNKYFDRNPSPIYWAVWTDLVSG